VQSIDAGAALRAGYLVQKRWRLVRQLGQGSFGQVWLAEDLGMYDIERAIKFVLDPAVADSVRREAKRLVQLERGSVDWRHLARLLHILPGAVPTLIYEFIEGEDLLTHAAQYDGGRLPIHAAVDITSQILAGLVELHRAGIVHRDLHPGNIKVVQGAPEYLVKILDLGLAWPGLQPEWISGVSALLVEPIHPFAERVEQRGGEAPDAQTDLFSVGVLLCWLLTGQPGLPVGKSLAQAWRKGPAALRKVVERASVAPRQQRYRSAAEMAEALTEAFRSPSAFTLPKAEPGLPDEDAGYDDEEDDFTCPRCGRDVRGCDCFRISPQDEDDGYDDDEDDFTCPRCGRDARGCDCFRISPQIAPAASPSIPEDDSGEIDDGALVGEVEAASIDALSAALTERLIAAVEEEGLEVVRQRLTAVAKEEGLEVPEGIEELFALVMASYFARQNGLKVPENWMDAGEALSPSCESLDGGLLADAATPESAATRVDSEGEGDDQNDDEAFDCPRCGADARACERYREPFRVASRTTSAMARGTLTVRADGKGEYRTLEEALAQVPAGAVVELDAGEHRLSRPATVTRAITLLGAGTERTTVVCAGAGHVLLFKGEGPFAMEGITFQHHGTADADVVVVDEGEIEFVQCAFAGAICNENRLDGIGGKGLCLKGRIWGRITKCLSNNNQGTGIWIDGRAGPSLEGNNCIENGYLGIMVGGESQPMLTGNTCQRNDGGICYIQSAAGTAIQNDCSENGLLGIWLTDDAHPILDANICRQNQCGICYFDGSAGTARKNTCSQNIQVGICVSAQAQPLLEDNTCEQNNGSGIWYIGSAQGVARGNVCCSNAEHGIHVAEHAEPRLEDNVCLANSIYGIALTDQAHPLLLNNMGSKIGAEGQTIEDEDLPF
jgi:parallel beta-helix repeat protein